MVFVSPKFILVETLRRRLTDPRNRFESTNAETFTATPGQSTFTLTPPSSGYFSCVTSITVNAVTKTKWQDYYIEPQGTDTDGKRSKVIFYTAMAGSETVIINYKYGAANADNTKNWIVWGKPNETITQTSLPRISVWMIDVQTNQLGSDEAPMLHNAHFQIDIWVKEGPSLQTQVFTNDSVKRTGDRLAEYLAHQLVSNLRLYQGDLYPALFDMTIMSGPRDLPYDTEFQAHHKIVEVMLNGINLGEA